MLHPQQSSLDNSGRQEREEVGGEEHARQKMDSTEDNMDSRPSPSKASSSVTGAARPANLRNNTDPTPSILLQSWSREKEQSNRSTSHSTHRNRSPYSRSHLRSRSSGSSLLSAPLMTRAHSLPNTHIPKLDQVSLSTSPSSGSLSPASQRSPARARSPFKEDGAYTPPPRSPAWFDTSMSMASGSANVMIEAIQEDSELDLTPRPHSAHNMLPPPAALAPHSTSRSVSASSLRRRPASPLHSIGAPQNDNTAIPNYPSSAMASPSLGPQQQTKYINEPHPFHLHHSSSASSISASVHSSNPTSIPSTPTSLRSRSPSISSLDTIEDAPDLEESEELEAEMLRLQMSNEAESDSEGEGSVIGRRKGSLELGGGRSWRVRGGAMGERKRWSVCGGERRGDLLDLETIWED